MSDQPDMLWWESTADPDTGAPMVMLRWGDKAQVFDTERALATCRDVFAAAEAADADKALWTVLTKRLRLDQSTAAAALADIRAHRTTMHTAGGGKPFLRIQALVGYRTGQALVHIRRGSLQMELTADQARTEAERWHQVAVASILDARIRYTLGDHGFDKTRIEAFMSDLATLQRD